MSRIIPLDVSIFARAPLLARLPPAPRSLRPLDEGGGGKRHLGKMWFGCCISEADIMHSLRARLQLYLDQHLVPRCIVVIGAE